ncbi:MAG TPA: TetR/AcrR family transcriptional regulator [Myxococcota bacterium]|nr:TetR/AcrR family transcriptional regulator [Myxococcota bacterium]
MEPDPKARRPTQAERSAESERRLLEAATQLVAEQGFSRTTLAQIGEKAGYSRGLVNERFGSKARLAAALASEFQSHFTLDQLQPALAGHSGLEALILTIESYLDFIVNGELLGRAYYELLGESIALVPEIHPTFVQADKTLREGIARTVRSAVRAGEIPAEVAVEPFAVMIVGLVRGVVLQWLLAPSGFELGAVRREIRATLERAFGKGK